MAYGRRLLAAVAGGLVGLSLLAVPAHAGDPPAYAPTMLVLDGSGSMTAADPSGGTKMAAAKKAAHTFVTAAPAEAKVGLAVYGTGTGNSDAEKAAGCRDVKLVHPVDTLDRTALGAAVDAVKPSGYTPIGTALRVAAKALPAEGPRAIVLVSDGADTCAPPDPCQVAKELHAKGLDLVVHTVGFGVDDASRKQLTCIAQSTGGTYSDAPDGAALDRVLPRVSAAALRNYQPAGTAITGTSSYRPAPVATPGQYLDTIGQKETRYYAVDVPTGATAYVSGTVSFPHLTGIDGTEDIDTMSIRVYGRDGQDCYQFETEEATSASDGVSLTIAKTWDGAAKDPTEYQKGSATEKCRGGGRYWFAIAWDTVSDGLPSRLPLELLVGIEPKVTDPGPAASTARATAGTPTGTPTAVTGGGSFNVAAALASSGRYADTLQRGEVVYYRVRLGWGHSLAYTVDYGQSGSTGIDDLSSVGTTLYTPLREEIVKDYNSFNGTPQTLSGSGDPLATVPIRYRNRGSDEVGYRSQSVPGWYYIAVKVSTARENRNAPPVPVTINLTVGGADETGPTYATPVRGGIFGENAHPAPPRKAADRPPLRAAADESSPVLVGGIVAAALAAVALLAVVTTVVLRRRRRPTGPPRA